MFTEIYPPTSLVYEVTDNGITWRTVAMLDASGIEKAKQSKPQAVKRARLRDIYSGKTEELEVIPAHVTALMLNIAARTTELSSRGLMPEDRHYKRLYSEMILWLEQREWDKAHRVGTTMMNILREHWS